MDMSAHGVVWFFFVGAIQDMHLHLWTLILREAQSFYGNNAPLAFPDKAPANHSVDIHSAFPPLKLTVPFYWVALE